MQEDRVDQSGHPPRRRSRPRLARLYYALAIFDLFTVCLSLYVIARVGNLFTDAVEVNKQWAVRQRDFSELNRLAVAVNTPGNEVFQTLEADFEEKRLNEAITLFRLKESNVRADLEAGVEAEHRQVLLKGLDELDPEMNELIEQAEQIFVHFRAKEMAEAGAAMASMDGAYRQVYEQLSNLTDQVMTIQNRRLDEQATVAESVRRMEFVIAGLIVLMVIAVTFYGYRLSRRVQKDEEVLETLVAERTTALEASHEQLRLVERMASIGTLAAGLGHDMNNMLFPVRCRLDALDSVELSSSVREELTMVRRSVDYLQQLSDGLRLLALDPTDDKATAGTVDLRRWWEEVGPLFHAALPRHAKLEVDLPDSLPMVMVATHGLTQATFNLVVNAGEVVGDGGTVRVWARSVSDRGQVQVAVSDDGPGMSAEVKRQALDPFFTTKTRGLSTGLGLTLAHGVAKAAGGTIDIDSTPGDGTTVRLTLPAMEPVAPTDAAGHAPAAISVRDRRKATMIAALLQPAGYRVDQGAVSPQDVRLWVTDDSDAALDRARRFLSEPSSGRVLVLADEEDGQRAKAWRRLGAVVIDSRDGFAGIQEGIRSVSCSPAGAAQ